MLFKVQNWLFMAVALHLMLFLSPFTSAKLQSVWVIPWLLNWFMFILTLKIDFTSWLLWDVYLSFWWIPCYSVEFLDILRTTIRILLLQSVFLWFMIQMACSVKLSSTFLNIWINNTIILLKHYCRRAKNLEKLEIALEVLTFSGKG